MPSPTQCAIFIAAPFDRESSTNLLGNATSFFFFFWWWNDNNAKADGVVYIIDQSYVSFAFVFLRLLFCVQLRFIIMTKCTRAKKNNVANEIFAFFFSIFLSESISDNFLFHWIPLLSFARFWRMEETTSKWDDAIPGVAVFWWTSDVIVNYFALLCRLLKKMQNKLAPLFVTSANRYLICLAS